MSKTFKIATFNTNSVRARLPIILDWLKTNKPDALCLQETKVQDHDFPVSDFNLAGYHVVFRGQKSYNGVAIASREKPLDVAYGLDDGGHQPHVGPGRAQHRRRSHPRLQSQGVAPVRRPGPGARGRPFRPAHFRLARPAYR